MALEGPRLTYARQEERQDETSMVSANVARNVARALRLAREVEELLADVPGASAESAATVRSRHIARAMAASLVDELEAVTAVGGRAVAARAGNVA